MAFDAQDIPPHIAAARALADRAKAKTDDMNRWVAKAKGGNPNKLVSARDALPHAFAEISAQLSPRKGG